MMVVSCIFIVLGGAFGIRTALFLKHSVPAKGTIIKLIESRDKDGHVLYAPIFRFPDAQGNIHEISSSVASYPPSGNIGDNIDILYSPEYPDHAEENSLFSLWGIALISGGLGIFYFLLFWFVVFFTNKRVNPSVG
jgi:hypothetical protein